MIYTIIGLMLTSTAFLALTAPLSYIFGTIGIMLILVDIVKMSAQKPATVTAE